MAFFNTGLLRQGSDQPRFAGVIPVGDAFQRASTSGVAKDDDFYDAYGVYTTRRRRTGWTCGGTTTCTQASTART